jgi:hypothetical protein
MSQRAMLYIHFLYLFLKVSVNTAVIRIMKLAIEDAAKLISSSQWDFILCGLAGWLQVWYSYLFVGVGEGSGWL